ncbi:MAG TPA: efflux RND transporter periplasmic adaptor subunit [Pseudolabrys sp.]|nr:efflux RND transporter periplasmic adaptor subunit [Pseudolabrys sp.]
MRLIIPAIFLPLAVALPALGQQSAPPAIPVGTVVAEKKSITPSLEFVGRVDAVNRVEIKARITGFLEEVVFTEGGAVKDGAQLYRIERGLFEAAVKQAEGALERAKSAKVLTEIQLKRAEDLLKTNSGTVVARDQALASDEQANGSVLEAQANLQTAQINLGYTDITSPISGKIGRTSITKGNVVSPSTGTLTTIVSQDPMYVTFPVSQRDFLRAQQTGRGPDVKSLKVKLRYSDGTFYDQVGDMNFVDVIVDRATDTITARATVPNPKAGLIDGQLMTVVVEPDRPEQRIVIPQSALLADQAGVYVFVVDDGKAAIRRVKPGGPSGTGIVIESGLTGGELVVVEGLQSIRPGAAVRASPVTPAG